jgi:hypothetical protein
MVLGNVTDPERRDHAGRPVQGGLMVTRFLVQARDYFSIDTQQITAAGGRLIGVGRLEDDGTVTVDVDVNDIDTNRRLSALFASAHHG